MRPINKATIDLVKHFEGLELDAYRDSAGVWTIGYGTTARAGVGISPKAGDRITEAEAEFYLEKGLNKFAEQIKGMITAPINDNQFGAFLSLAYNIGPSAFSRSSSLRHFNNGDIERASNNILLWNKATVGGKKVVLKGLERRRAAEYNLFHAPVEKAPLTKPRKSDKVKDEFSLWGFIADVLLNWRSKDG